jgi:hypothetical protein
MDPLLPAFANFLDILQTEKLNLKYIKINLLTAPAARRAVTEARGPGADPESDGQPQGSGRAAAGGPLRQSGRRAGLSRSDSSQRGSLAIAAQWGGRSPGLGVRRVTVRVAEPASESLHALTSRSPWHGHWHGRRGSTARPPATVTVTKPHAASFPHAGRLPSQPA